MFSNAENPLARRDIIRRTYENARANGDDRVWFVDGGTYFENINPSLCTTDTVHPNDLGFYFMAQTIEPAMREMLESLE